MNTHKSHFPERKVEDVLVFMVEQENGLIRLNEIEDYLNQKSELFPTSVTRQ